MEDDQALQDYFRWFDGLIIDLIVAGRKPSTKDKVTWLTSELPRKFESVMDDIKGDATVQDIAEIKAQLLKKRRWIKTSNAIQNSHVS